jgi:pimeloyl-ACP methyl ester carboxylesterase
MRRATVGLLIGFTLVLISALVGSWVFVWERTYPPTTPLATQCDHVPDGAERVTLSRDDGMTLGAALVGPTDAQVGVVLRQGAGQTICQWLPWAGELADATGAQVLLFDRRGRGSSPGARDLTAEPADLVSAVDFLRRGGVDEVAMAASSMGNSVMFSALGQMPTAPCAIVAISPVLVAGDSRGTVDGTAVDGLLPRNIWLSWEEFDSGVAANAEFIQSRARSSGLPAPHALSVETSHHSIGLVVKHEEVRGFITDAIRSC